MGRSPFGAGGAGGRGSDSGSWRRLCLLADKRASPRDLLSQGNYYLHPLSLSEASVWTVSYGMDDLALKRPSGAPGSLGEDRLQDAARHPLSPAPGAQGQALTPPTGTGCAQRTHWDPVYRTSRDSDGICTHICNKRITGTDVPSAACHGRCTLCPRSTHSGDSVRRRNCWDQGSSSAGQ